MILLLFFPLPPLTGLPTRAWFVGRWRQWRTAMRGSAKGGDRWFSTPPPTLPGTTCGKGWIGATYIHFVHVIILYVCLYTYTYIIIYTAAMARVRFVYILFTYIGYVTVTREGKWVGKL